MTFRGWQQAENLTRKRSYKVRAAAIRVAAWAAARTVDADCRACYECAARSGSLTVTIFSSAELQARISRTDAHATEIFPSIEEVRSRIQSIEAQKSKLLADIERLRAAKDTSAASLQSLTQQMAALKHASQALMADHTATVPRVK